MASSVVRQEQLAGRRRPGRSVAEDPAQGSGWPPSEVRERHERFAALIRVEQPAILTAYANSLEASGSPLIADSHASGQAMMDASEIISDVAARVQGSDLQTERRYEMLPLIAGLAGSESQLSPADLLGAAGTFFDVTVSSLASHVKNDPELLPCFTTAIVALYENISRRIREATLAYTGYLLERVDQAHIDERHRIARDLHDRLGEGMSVALRQLELHELTSNTDSLTLSPRAAMAKEAITEAMRRLRVVTSDLRQESVRSLEKALIQYIDAAARDVAADADVRLRVSGDETWASPTIIDQAFLIIREAIRNALRHGTPRMVLIGVAFAPHQLRAWVEDDGCGYVSGPCADPVSGGTGLTSMRERAALIGGRLTISSIPGHGTHVELLVPLPGHPDE
jgi:signal transduction histidine kinase